MVSTSISWSRPSRPFKATLIWQNSPSARKRSGSNGGHSQTKIQSFYGAAAEDASRPQPFILEGDEPPVLLGANHGPNAVEVVLHALASCLAVGFIYNAAAQGIKVDSLDFSLEGELYLHAFLVLSDQMRPGYKNITINYRVKSDAPLEKLEALC